MFVASQPGLSEMGAALCAPSHAFAFGFTKKPLPAHRICILSLWLLRSEQRVKN
jgi:hypothetical protein